MSDTAESDDVRAKRKRNPDCQDCRRERPLLSAADFVLREMMEQLQIPAGRVQEWVALIEERDEQVRANEREQP